MSSSRPITMIEPDCPCFTVVQYFQEHNAFHFDRSSIGRCCRCKRRTPFETITRRVSHPCGYWCPMCGHRFDVGPIESPQTWKACGVCRHTCPSCVGADSPMVYNIHVECNSCLGKTFFRLLNDLPNAAQAWMRLSRSEERGAQRWGGRCLGGCGYRPNPFPSPGEGNGGGYDSYGLQKYDKINFIRRDAADYEVLHDKTLRLIKSIG